MIKTLPTKAREIFKDTGKLPIALHILTSSDRVKINYFYKVCEAYGLLVEDILDSIK